MADENPVSRPEFDGLKKDVRALVESFGEFKDQILKELKDTRRDSRVPVGPIITVFITTAVIAGSLVVFAIHGETNPLFVTNTHQTDAISQIAEQLRDEDDTNVEQAVAIARNEAAATAQVSALMRSVDALQQRVDNFADTRPDLAARIQDEINKINGAN